MPNNRSGQVAPASPANFVTGIRLINDVVYLKIRYNAALVDSLRQIRVATGSKGWNGKEWELLITSVPSLLALKLPIPRAIVERYNYLYDKDELPVFVPVAITAVLDQTKAQEKLRSRIVVQDGIDHDLIARAREYMDEIDVKMKVEDRKLMAHQRRFIVEAIKAGGRVECAHDVGTGKTLSSLIVAHLYATKFHADILVVAPVSLKDNWLREAAKYTDDDIEVYSAAKFPPTPTKPFVLICDEAHYYQHLKYKWVNNVKTITPKRTGEMLRLALADNCIAYVAASGTPCPNGKAEALYPILLACRSWIASDQKAYEDAFCGAPDPWGNFSAASESALYRLYDLTQKIIFRKKKTDCLDLPKFERLMRPVNLRKHEVAIYEDAFNRLRREWRTRVDAGIISNKNEGLVVLSQLLHAASVAKVCNTADLANDLVSNDNQTLLAFAYKDALDDVAARLHHPYEIIDGDVPQKHRQPIVDDFQSGRFRTILFTHGSGGVGLNMQAGDYVILHDRPWTPGGVEQIEGRAWRSGRTRPVISLWQQVNDSDRAVDEVLRIKQHNTDIVVDGKPGLPMAMDIVINGKHTILPDYQESIGEIANSLLAALFGNETHELETEEDET